MMFVLVYISGFVLFLLMVGKTVLHQMFNKEIRQLFSMPAGGQTDFNPSTLTGLPEPVQRYFNYSLKKGQPSIQYARIKHTGTFKTGMDKQWIRITGEQYATTGTPGFIWKGETSFFSARDMFISNKGRLVVSLLSLIKIVDAKGKQYDEGELQRWLGESVLYPTNLLPGRFVTWTAIDQNSAKLNFRYQSFDLYFIVTFSTQGEITKLETLRYMDATRLEPWSILLSDYKNINNVIVPTYFEVSWILKEQTFTYARFRITRVEYDIPKAF